MHAFATTINGFQALREDAGWTLGEIASDNCPVIFSASIHQEPPVVSRTLSNVSCLQLPDNDQDSAFREKWQI